MEYDKNLDQEIDEDMGWVEKLKQGEARRKRAGGFVPGLSLLQLLKRVAFPARVARGLKSAARRVGKVLFFPLISPLGYSKKFDVSGDVMVMKRSWKWRMADALLTRLMLAPVILAIFLIGVVYASTHPQRVQAGATPEMLGLYYKRVRLVTVDGQGLTAWYIPAMTADEMAFDPEASLAQKWPGVVVCHGLGASHDQYMPLAGELHRAGFAVLMVDTRGQGESEPAAITYGLREQLDVLAGVKYLHELPNIDGAKICAVGHDIGATASLQAAALDSSIAAVVVDGMWPRFEDRAYQIFSQPGGRNVPTGWLAPLYTMAFEVSIRGRLSQLDPETAVRNIHTQPIFFIARQGAQYAPVDKVMMMATNAGAHHEVMTADDRVSNPDVEARISAFLSRSIGWKGPHSRGIGEIQKLLDSRVK